MKLLKRNQKVTSRRQRQSVGSGAPGAYNYRAQRSDFVANTGRDKRRVALSVSKSDVKKLSSFWGQRIGGLALIIAGLLFIVTTLSLSQEARVISLATKDAPLLRSQKTYQDAASDILELSVFNKSKITINNAAIRAAMLKQFPELQDVTVTLPFLAHRPVVYVQPAQPTMILISGSGSFVLDTNGKAILTSSALLPTSGLTLPQVTDQSGLPVKLDQQVLTSGDIRFIQTIVTQLAARQVFIDTLTLPVASRQLEAHITGQPYTVKFNLASDTARQQAGTFLATINRLAGQGITPGSYIDVRVDGRAYYQ